MLTNLDKVTLNKNPNSDNALSKKNCIDDELGRNTNLRLSQTPENFLKVSVGNDVFNLFKYEKMQITDTTFFKNPVTCGYLLQLGTIKRNDIKRINENYKVL